MSSYSPQQAATISGFSLDTLRYYERIGLIPRVRRTTTGRRVFGDIDLKWLAMLRCLRDTGMPIAQMRRYAELCRSGEGTFTERIELLDEHDRAVDEQIRVLRAQQQHVREKIAWYRARS